MLHIGEEAAIMMSADGRRLLIVDDDDTLRRLLQDYFTGLGYRVSGCRDADEALQSIQRQGLPHLALLDVNLPRMDGFELSSLIKAKGDVPIVFISIEGEIDTVVDGLIRFADDYIKKPFDLRELGARVQRVLSRFPDFDYLQMPVIEVDERLSVDFGNSQVLLDGKPASLTPIEANLLHILMRSAGSVVTSEQLIARVWLNDEVYEDTLRVHMHRLRRKLEPDRRHPGYIQTERGIGYRFMPLKPQTVEKLTSYKTP